jgi:hypothetical protein
VWLVKVNGDKISAGIAIIAIIFIFSLACPNTEAQTSTSFTPADKFLVPAYNGSISFAVNGTYSNANFENNTWTFTNLHLNRSTLLENFEISTQNSNVTVVSYESNNNTVAQSATLRCVVEGNGKQTLNFGLGPGKGELDWSLGYNGTDVGRGEGEGWNVLHNGTIVLTDLTGSLSITRFDYLGSSSNLPFYQQHSVAIAVAIIFALVVGAAVLTKVKSREPSNESGQANKQRLNIKNNRKSKDDVGTPQ